MFEDDPDLEVFDLRDEDKHRRQGDSLTRRRTVSRDRDPLVNDKSPSKAGWSEKAAHKVDDGHPKKSHESPPSAAPSIYQQLVGLLLNDDP
ncbi:hypothetical protein FHG87_012688, partial [Trinorchestia longiramus]